MPFSGLRPYSAIRNLQSEIGRGGGAGGRRQKAEGRRQEAEGRGQKAGGRRQRAEGRGQKAEGRRQEAEGRGNGDKGKEVFADLLGLRPSVPWSLEHWERGWTGLPVDLSAVADPDQVDDLLL